MKKRSILYIWAIELASLLLLTVCMCVVLTGSARKRLLGEYEQITALQQEKIETSLESYFSQLGVQAVEILNDGNVSTFAYLKKPAIADNYTLYLVQNCLRSKVNAGVAKHIYIYYQNIQRAITDETILETEDCTRQLLGSADAESLQWFAGLVNQTSLNRLVVTGSGENTVVLCMTSIPSVGRLPRAMIIQQVPAEKLLQILNSQSSLEQATTLLLNEENRIVCYTGDSALAAQLATDYDVSGKTNRFNSDGRQYWVCQTRISSTGWTLITAAPMEIIESRSNWVWKSALVFIFALAVVWAVASAAIIRWNYRPLKELEKHTSFIFDGSKNEYDQLDQAFRTVQNDLQDLKRMQQKHREVLRYEWLGNAIAYDIPLYSMVANDFMTLDGIDLTKTVWQMLLLRSEQALEAVESFPEQPDCNSILTSPKGRSVLCLFASGEQQLQTYFGMVEQSLKQNGVEYISSGPHTGLNGMHDEFLFLCEQADRPAPGTEGAISALRLSFANSDEIVQKVFESKGEEACSLLARSAAANLSGQSVSAHLARMYYNDFLLRLLNNVPEGSVCTEVQRAIVSTSRAVSGAVELAVMQELIETLVLAISAKYRPAAGEAQADLLDRCIVCVREHFREHDFNVSRMADLLGVNVPYLSKYFKEHAGVNLLGYLNSVRIDYAKKLIAEEKLSVAAAADRAGFENINTFIRLFKKYVGDTPGSYSKQ